MHKDKLISFVEEDRGPGDVTTEAMLAGQSQVKLGEATVIFKENGVLAGSGEARTIYQHYGLSMTLLKEEGEQVRAGETVMKLSGEAAQILLVERSILNLMSRMSGIATATRQAVVRARAKNPKLRVAATRKTAPGLSYFDKKAVVIGGGDPHRSGLYDAVLIKENHIELAGGVREALKRARDHVSFSKKVEIEVESEEDAFTALEGGADIIMLDNMAPKQAKKLYRKLKKKRPGVLIELSGGITPDNITDYADCGDIISMGWLTHSVKEIDISLYLKLKK